MLNKWTDTENLLAYMAVDDALNNWDGVTAWYCFGTCEPHNMYWYVTEADERFFMIPWDLDNTNQSFNPMSGIPHWRTTPEDCSETFPVSWGDQLQAPGCDPVFQGLATDAEGYVAQVDRLLSEHFLVDSLSTQIDGWAEMIRGEIQADPTGVDAAAWEGAVGRLKNQLGVSRSKLEGLRDAALNSN